MSAEREPDWRVEADDAWLAGHSSDSFNRVRAMVPWLAVLADGVSQAETGPFGGAPRNPQLKVGGRAYSLLREARAEFAHTAVRVGEPARCARCDRPLAEAHNIVDAREDGEALPVGGFMGCRGCQGDSWLFRSHMPRTGSARDAARKTVL